MNRIDLLLAVNRSERRSVVSGVEGRISIWFILYSKRHFNTINSLLKAEELRILQQYIQRSKIHRNNRFLLSKLNKEQEIFSLQARRNLNLKTEFCCL